MDTEFMQYGVVSRHRHRVVRLPMWRYDAVGKLVFMTTGSLTVLFESNAQRLNVMQKNNVSSTCVRPKKKKSIEDIDSYEHNNIYTWQRR